MEARNTLPPDPPASDPPAPPVVLAPVTFRKATLLVDDPDEFRDAVISGQAQYVDETENGKTLTAETLVNTLADVLKDRRYGASAGWTSGFLVGYIDALLRGRKRYPSGCWW